MPFSVVSTESIATWISISHFSSKWERRESQPGQLKSELIHIAGWSLTLELWEDECNDISVALRRVNDSKHVLHLRKSFLEWMGLEVEIGAGNFYPAWIWKDGEDLAVLTMPTNKDELLSSAARNDDTFWMFVRLNVNLHALPIDPQSCLKLHPLKFASLLESDLVTLSGKDDCNVKVHANLLSAHSPVLSAALKSEMEESRTKKIAMPDTDRQTIEDLLACLVSGGLPPCLLTDWLRISNLLLLSDKYAITPLADACSFYLAMALSEDNALQMFSFCDRYGFPKLRKAVMFFTMHHEHQLVHDAIVDSDEFEHFSLRLVHEFRAYEAMEKTQIEPPAHFQWGDIDNEFDDHTHWETLSKDCLRRACFERSLATDGTSAELANRLSKQGSAQQLEDNECAGKRQRTS